MAGTARDVNRTARENAVKKFNELAEGLGLDTVPVRAKTDDAVALYKSLCKKIAPDMLEHLLAAREEYVSHGGTAELPEELAQRAQEQQTKQADVDGPVSAHRHVGQSFYEPGRTSFRLHSKAFMLTFNSSSFAATWLCWQSFLAWVKERAQHFKASAWSCTLEKSLASDDQGRVHAHCYFSLHGAQTAGIDHATTDEWVFQGSRPRVDANSENRGPHHWLRAAQHGHFYVWVMKKGTLFTAALFNNGILQIFGVPCVFHSNIFPCAIQIQRQFTQLKSSS